MVKTRQMTRSKLALSELGLGCATLAVNASPEAVNDARAMLHDALSNGINYFDTAPFYGRGLSERLVGDALRKERKETSATIVSSKSGRLLIPSSSASHHMPFQVVFDYTYDGIMKSVDHSYHRLGLSQIDILFAHDLGHHTHADNAPFQFTTFMDGGGYRAMEELRNAGVVKAIGLGVNEIAICEQAMAYGSFDVFLLAGRYTLLERTAALSFFERCAQAETDIVIGGPFNSGMLVGGSTYNYRAIPQHIADQHRLLLNLCKKHSVEVGAAATQFPLRHNLVKSVIPGPKTRKELAQIVSWYSMDIPNNFWSELDSLSD